MACSQIFETIYTPDEVGIDAFQADHSPTHMYRTAKSIESCAIRAYCVGASSFIFCRTVAALSAYVFGQFVK